MNLIHCLTFDIEEHFHVSAFDSPMRRRHWNRFESRVQRTTERLLDLLVKENVRATFFVLGWVAERHPALVRTILKAGHEVASLGYSHEMISAQTPEQFREDVRKAKMVLENILAQPVLGFRAPGFRITQDTIWALRILVEEGYVYDSSASPNLPMLPIVPHRKGQPGIDGLCHCLPTDAGTLWEIPPSTIHVAGVRISIAGNEYFRLLPYGLLLRLLKWGARDGQPLVMCLRSWELDPDQPRMSGPLLSCFRHYVNLHKTEGRLVHLLREFRFLPIRDAIAPVGEWDREKAQIAYPDLSPGKTRLTKSSWLPGSRDEVDLL
jgi:polysaccharide deacetylase family protein (PEP-CTERM system associated)